jgi:hypothetical protein
VTRTVIRLIPCFFLPLELMLHYAPIPLLLSVLALSGCQRESPSAPSASNILAINDFDNLDGWLANSPAAATLSRSQAHSGAYSIRVDSTQEFSLGYANTLGRLAPDWPAKLIVSAWVLLPSDQAGAKLVMEVKGATPNAPNLLWDGLALNKAVKAYNKWQYVEQIITMPDAARPTNRLQVYLWRADSKLPVYLDDLKIELAE